MDLTDLLTISAIILAPVFALQISAALERRREKRQRRFRLFRTLMATRAYNLSQDHVRALNTIDIEFDGKDKKSQNVLRAWNAYHDHLGTSRENLEIWNASRQDLLIELLYRMGKSLGYDFDKTSIKRTSYFPNGYVDMEEDQLTIRRGLAQILSGDNYLPIQFYSDEESESDAAGKIGQVEEFLKSGKIRIEIVNGQDILLLSEDKGDRA
ncbi:MAG: DUF6680 family protein [Bacteroidota bacterium]